MNIQQSINAALGSMTIAARLNPFLEQRTAAKSAEQLSRKAGEFISAESEHMRPIKQQTESEIAADVEFAESAADYAREAFALNPTRANRDEMVSLVEHAYEAREMQEDELARRKQVAAEKAAESARLEQEKVRKQQASKEFVSIMLGGGGDIEEWRKKYGGEA